MATIHEEGERIALSQNDTLILTALLAGPMKAYQIATQSQADIKGAERMSNGALRPALKSLSAMHLIAKVDGQYRITALGKQVIALESYTLGRISSLIKKRIKYC